MKTLTAKELALYLGCEVMIFTDSSNPKTPPEKKRLIACKSEIRYEISLCAAEYLKAKPILRQLSDISKEEGRESVIARGDADAVGGVPEAFQTAYLLSKHFDLFGWIEQGLAIDKSTLTSSPDV